MVDSTQNLTGTVTSVRVAEANATPTVSLSPNASGDTAALGLAAPVNPVSAASRPSIEVNSATAEVLASMRDMPPPIDIEATTEIREAIRANNYPIDLSKVAGSLLQSLDSLS
ncbi:flagellar biosynthesis anti-sigma factor FlgM [Lacimonas salitolerans]|uniref:Flagellar biosynthesis anti-sigma factor FlgM n=1 Tax=Lacimonas salitolerans TaxID=1323750 RepID=A0ABW4EKM9_9RHOB